MDSTLPKLTGYRSRHMISLGLTCYPRTILQKLGSKLFASPFDWMCATVPMAAACIASGFPEFINGRYYRPVTSPGKTDCEHTFHETQWKANLTHDDPTSEAGHACRERFVDRFRAVLRYADPKPFLFFAQIHAHRRDRYLGDFERLAASIEARTACLTLVGIVSKFTEAKSALVEVMRTGPHRLVHCDAGSFRKCIKFGHAADDASITRFVEGLTPAALRLDMLGAVHQAKIVV